MNQSYYTQHLSIDKYSNAEYNIAHNLEESEEVVKMKNRIILSVIAVILLIFGLSCLCMYGCNTNQDNQERAYKTAIAKHLNDIHGLSIDNYEYFHINEYGAIASVALEMDDSMDIIDLVLDQNHGIDYCYLCDWEAEDNEDGQEPEDLSDMYQDFILRKTEQLTGFSISLEMGNYEEHEITEYGHTYIGVTAFINIEEMAGTYINFPEVFQLYAVINQDDTEDLFIAITGNSTGEIYRYDHLISYPHETTNNDSNENNTSAFSEPEDWRTQFSGYAKISNGWIYYSGADGLCRMKTDGSDRQWMSSDDVSGIKIIEDDWVYYNDRDTIYRIKTDGSNRQVLYTEPNWLLDEYTVEKGWIYCRNEDDEIFRMNADVGNKKKLIRWGSMGGSIAVSGNWLYFGDLCRIQTDGANLQEFSFPGSYSIMAVVDDWVYSRKYDGVVRTKTDGSEEQMLIEDGGAWILNCAVAGDWIYYLFKGGDMFISDDQYRLCRIRKDGTEEAQFLFDESIEYFIVDGDWIYYWNYDDTWRCSGLFRIKTDGSQKQLICES